jgi:nucleoside-diphosphate-sugar epimerase
MISGEKILVTGATGMVAGPLARYLAADNEVWGLARFAEPSTPAQLDPRSAPVQSKRQALTAAGITTFAADLGAGTLDGLPDDFTYVLHLGWMRSDVSRLEEAMRVNVEGTGLLLQHCRRAKATLVMSSTAVYSANPDPWHLYAESDPIGQGVTGQTASTSPACKLGAESVARYCARAHGQRVVIARLNTFMGPPTSFPAMHIGAALAGKAMVAPHNPSPHSPIHVEDMKLQLEALLDAAESPAFITNWGGDEVVTAQQWTAWASEWSGQPAELAVRQIPGSPPGAAADPARRRSITGPCTIDVEASFHELYNVMAGH